jgi:hypothetical protein
VLKRPRGRRIFPYDALQQKRYQVRSILNSNQFQIVRGKGLPFRVLHFHSKGFSGAFVQNLKAFLAQEITSIASTREG